MKLHCVPWFLNRYLSLIVGVAVLALLILLCVPSRVAFASSKSPAFVRIIHASPDIGIVDAFMDGTKILSSFQFGTVTDYVPVVAGSHTIQIALLGKGVNAALVTKTMMVNEGVPYTIAALGTNASGFALSVFQDNNFVVGVGAKLRVYCLAPTTGTVNVETGARTIVQGLAYPQASNYVTVPVGSYTFNLTGAAQQVPSPLATTLQGWTVTSIFAIGPQNGDKQISFVSSQIAGVPGMPQTGSDPSPIPTPSFPLWLTDVLAGGVLAIYMLMRTKYSFHVNVKYK